MKINTQTFINKFPWQFLLIATLSAIYIKNYWLAEDAYINFRSLDQLWVGNGPVWNIGERVQVYTSALWYWLTAASRFLINDLYWATFFCSFFLFILTASKIIKSFNHNALCTIALFIVLLSSNSFMDFSASGLENILLYFLLTILFVLFRSHKKVPRINIYFISSLLLLTRHDQLILIAPIILSLSITHWKSEGFLKATRLISLGFFPFIGWTFLSLIYYGFPFPNTAYAKLSTGIPKSELIQRGIDYFWISNHYDHLLPILFVCGIIAGALQKNFRLLAVGIAINIAYVIYVGGDYMQGRFFSHLYLVCALMLFSFIYQQKPRNSNILCVFIIAACISWNFKADYTPLTTDIRFNYHIKTNGTANERGIFFPSTSIFGRAASQAQQHPFPDWPFYSEGLKLRDLKESWTVATNIGMTGYASGLQLHIFDRLALADPLLARLPALPGAWDPGHFVRDIPWGYPEANVNGGTYQIYDKDLNEYYATLRLITKSPDLFSIARLKAILRANLSPSFGRLRQSHIERWSQRGCKICLGENTPR